MTRMYAARILILKKVKQTTLLYFVQVRLLVELFVFVFYYMYNPKFIVVLLVEFAFIYIHVQKTAVIYLTDDDFVVGVYFLLPLSLSSFSTFRFFCSCCLFYSCCLLFTACCFLSLLSIFLLFCSINVLVTSTQGVFPEKENTTEQNQGECRCNQNK